MFTVKLTAIGLGNPAILEKYGITANFRMYGDTRSYVAALANVCTLNVHSSFVVLFLFDLTT